jgi:hypothetical protein
MICWDLSFVKGLRYFTFMKRKLIYGFWLCSLWIIDGGLHL